MIASHLVLLGAVASLQRAPAPAAPPPVAAGALVSAQSPPGAARPTALPTPHAIDRLLAEERWEAALAACEAVAVDPGGRDLATFLHQYGIALARTGRLEDASIMFMRQALLFPGARETSRSLLETAAILHDRFADPEGAERLLARAESIARAEADGALVRRCQALRRSWREQAARGAP